MITKSRKIIAIVLAVLFVTFTVLLFCTVFSDDNIRARDYLEYKKTDLGQMSNNAAKYIEAKDRVSTANTLTVIYSVLSVCSLGGSIAILCVKKK